VLKGPYVARTDTGSLVWKTVNLSIERMEPGGEGTAPGGPLLDAPVDDIGAGSGVRAG